jgi:hypothetical protein
MTLGRALLIGTAGRAVPRIGDSSCDEDMESMECAIECGIEFLGLVLSSPCGSGGGDMSAELVLGGRRLSTLPLRMARATWLVVGFILGSHGLIFGGSGGTGGVADGVGGSLMGGSPGEGGRDLRGGGMGSGIVGAGEAEFERLVLRIETGLLCSLIGLALEELAASLSTGDCSMTAGRSSLGMGSSFMRMMMS